MGVKSTLQTPLPVSESTVYVIEISSLTDNITWRREVFPRLKTIGAIFLNPLFRKRAEESYHCAYDSILKTTADLRSEVASLRAGMSALTSWAQSVSADHRRKSMLSDKDRGVAPHRLTLEQMERGYIEETLRQTGGRIKGEGGAARILGMNPATLYSRMKKLGITPYCR
jgi:transcriptional regulator of acetoin/glycerol metabolism